jgi:hypothetical protein
LPKQNRPLVRDGRIQAPKKRTDRSYLNTVSAPPAPPESETIPEAEVNIGVVEAPEAAPSAVAATAEPVGARAEPVAPARTYGTRATGAARAIQQQGVRSRRRELDVNALAERDTRYAMHELRRIAILATLVVITLVVLGIVLR